MTFAHLSRAKKLLNYGKCSAVVYVSEGQRLCEIIQGRNHTGLHQHKLTGFIHKWAIDQTISGCQSEIQCTNALSLLADMREEMFQAEQGQPKHLNMCSQEHFWLVVVICSISAVPFSNVRFCCLSRK